MPGILSQDPSKSPPPICGHQKCPWTLANVLWDDRWGRGGWGQPWLRTATLRLLLNYAYSELSRAFSSWLEKVNMFGCLKVCFSLTQMCGWDSLYSCICILSVSASEQLMAE